MQIVGHRGARGLAPENTLASIRKAIEHGADMVEFDLRVTTDGVVILHHDAHLMDPNGEEHKIVTTNYADLKQHKPDLATLNEVLTELDQKTRLYIEVKPKVNTEPIIKIIKKYSGGNLWLGCKNQKTLLELHIALPSVPKIVIEPWSGVRAHWRAKQVHTKLISMNQLWLWSFFIKSMTSGGYRLFAYTLNDPKKAKRWAKYGLYGVVTDYPERFDNL